MSARERTNLALVIERHAALILAALRAEHPGEPSTMAALLAARTVADASEEATRAFVRQAREEGHTWQEIGELLSISRQAAQQRFGARTDGESVAGVSALEDRAREIVEQLRNGDWEAVRSDWDERMLAELSAAKVAEVWRQIVATAGALQGTGRPAITRRGPYRIADVPLIFAHGPMKARISFNHAGTVSGLFILLPDAP